MLSQKAHSNESLGAVGYLAIFAFSLAVVMLAPAPRLPWAAGICLLMALVLYPQVFQRLVRVRFLILLLFLAIPPVFLVGVTDRSLWGISYSSEGLRYGLQIALRILVVLVAVQGLTSSVDISSIAGLLERFGFRGLGFSMGVALNLLPSLQQSAMNTWRSLQMRGGFRQKRWRGMYLLGVTIITGALSRSEEIALAAEARAFSPDRARAMPIKKGRWDWATAGICLLMLAVILWLP